MGLYDNLGDKLFYTRGILHFTKIYVYVMYGRGSIGHPGWRHVVILVYE